MIRGQEYGVYKGLEQRIRKGLDYKTRGKVWSMGIRIKDRERFGAKSKQKLLDFKQVFSGRKYDCKSPVYIFNWTIKACESVLEVKKKYYNYILS